MTSPWRILAASSGTQRADGPEKPNPSARKPGLPLRTPCSDQRDGLSPPKKPRFAMPSQDSTAIRQPWRFPCLAERVLAIDGPKQAALPARARRDPACWGSTRADQRRITGRPPPKDPRRTAPVEQLSRLGSSLLLAITAELAASGHSAFPVMNCWNGGGGMAIAANRPGRASPCFARAWRPAPGPASTSMHLNEPWPSRALF